MEREGASDEPGAAFWTDAYEASSHVGTEGRRVTGVQDIALIEGVTGGESVTETYELHHDTPEFVTGTLSIQRWRECEGRGGFGQYLSRFRTHSRRKPRLGTGYGGLTELTRTESRLPGATPLSSRR